MRGDSSMSNLSLTLFVIGVGSLLIAVYVSTKPENALLARINEKISDAETNSRLAVEKFEEISKTSKLLNELPDEVTALKEKVETLEKQSHTFEVILKTDGPLEFKSVDKKVEKKKPLFTQPNISKIPSYYPPRPLPAPQKSKGVTQ
jgi:hypothetical protein